MKIKQIKLLQFGSISTLHEDKMTNKNSLTGYFLYPSKIQFQENKDVLKGDIGLKFGIEYFIEGDENSRNGEDAVFFCKIKHPELQNPETNEKSSETIEKKIDWLNHVGFDYFSIEYDWELKLGTWTFQIFEEQNLLFEKSFEIV
jgi:hypothetical protein